MAFDHKSKLQRPEIREAVNPQIWEVVTVYFLSFFLSEVSTLVLCRQRRHNSSPTKSSPPARELRLIVCST